LPDLTPADFFLFSRVKEKLTGLTLTQESFKNSWEGVVRSIAKEDYATAFSAERSGAESAGKCRKVHSGQWQLMYVEKITQNKLFPKLIHGEVISPCPFDSTHTL
jgi:hypothetical protein